MKAPDFTLPDENGTVHSLTEFAGKWLVLYFYPKDDTTGCTKEACGFRDITPLFEKKNAQIVGISKDTVESHKNFKQKNHLTFPLLSDVSAEIIKAYAAWGKHEYKGKEYEGISRNTYLINPDGEIVKTFENVDPVSHPQEILNSLPE